jgi:hypothetical protein
MLSGPRFIPRHLCADRTFEDHPSASVTLRNVARRRDRCQQEVEPFLHYKYCAPMPQGTA